MYAARQENIDSYSQQTYRETDIYTVRQTDRHAGKQTYRQANRKIGSHTWKHSGRQSHRQTRRQDCR